MKKITIMLAAVLMLLPAVSNADEGMWMVNMFENSIYPQMKKMGLKLTGKEIYNEDVANSLSDAIVSLDFGCTGSMISKEGLLITNHHCAYGDIFRLSTKDHNYLENGFWAMNRDEEKPIPDKNALFLRKVIDVTAEVKAEREKLNKKGFRGMMMRRVYRMVETKYKSQYPGMECMCANMWSGEAFYMFVYEVFSDVRLVGAPPVSIGAFGGETDNWSWPQHKGDFAIYRVYTGKDGKPAKYSKDNVPMQPARTLAISAAPKKMGDFAMIMGYPGRTNRYASSFEVEQKQNIINPIVVEARRSRLNVWDKKMNENPDLRLIYSNIYFNISNYTDFAKWENKCLKRYNVIDIRRQEEKLLTEYAGTDIPIRKENEKLLENLKKSYNSSMSLTRNRTWYKEAYLLCCDWVTSCKKFAAIAREMQKGKIDSVDINSPLIKRYIKRAEIEFAKFDQSTDLELFGVMSNLFIQNLDRKYLSDTVKAWINRCNNSGEEFAKYVYNRSNFRTVEGIKAFFATPKSVNDILNDPVIVFNEGCNIQEFNRRGKCIDDSLGCCIEKLTPKYTHAIYNMRKSKGKPQYPNANSTMRLTYGSVCDIYPTDGVHYDYQTTINGYIDKQDNTNYEFRVDDKMNKLIAAKDWGKWGEKGNLYVNFLTNNDITGGNSGSPVMNGKGELIGLAFDGNRESMSGDIYYHPYYFKTVCVDIRFVLWIIDKYAGAQNILDELDIRYK